MFSIVKDTILSLLPAKRKTGNKWTSFNAPCCQHNGESRDTRGRGGIAPNPDGSVSYHCFNCGYKASYRPGRPLGYRMRKLLDWLGADENTIQRLVVEALRVKDLISTVEDHPQAPRKKAEYVPRPLPAESVSLKEWATYASLQDTDWVFPIEVLRAVDYVCKRDPTLVDRYDFYTTTETAYNLHKRVIVPFYWNHELIGYTARALDVDTKPKYHNSHDADYVFNLDKQLADAKFVIVTEGPFDAMAVDGIAILGNECSDIQADIIDDLKREVIVVPDFDIWRDEKTNKLKWSGRFLIDTALDNNWSVSFPVWAEQYKDVSEAVEHLGQLFVIKSIIDAKQSNPLKIELMCKRLYN